MIIRIPIHWAILFTVWCGLTGCMAWPFMSEGYGYRPIGMGKDDQVLWPWAPQPTVLVENHGQSVRQTLNDQIVNPAASENLSVIDQFDGKAANFAVDRYRGFFKKPPFAKTSSESKK